MTELIDKIHNRVPLCFGANPLAWDRLFKGNKEEAAYWKLALIRDRDFKEALAALDTAAHLIAERDAELADLRESVKDSGILSMGMGEKRDPEKGE